jgi:hypothetical protein
MTKMVFLQCKCCRSGMLISPGVVAQPSPSRTANWALQALPEKGGVHILTFTDRQ